MRQQRTASEAAVQQLAKEIKARRRQVQDTLEFSLQPGRYERTAGNRLMQVFASFRGIDEDVDSGR
jgi:hypothetical protein